MKITMRATYEDMWFDSDEPDTEPSYERGYTDPRNPWGGLRAEVPEGLCGEPFAEWRDENADVVTFDTIWEAAEFVVDFPGGVWDYCEGEYSRDMHTGIETSVTLHVDVDHAEAVFAIATFLQAQIDKKLASR